MEATIQTIMEAALQQGIWAALYILRTPLSKITSTGEIEQRFRLN